MASSYFRAGALAAAAVAMAAVASCSSDLSSAGADATGPNDSGNASADGGGDVRPGAADGSGANGAESAAIVHAAMDLFDFRLCVGVSSTADGGADEVLPMPALPNDPEHPMPQANYPGVAYGWGVPLPELLSVPASGSIVPYVVRAKTLQTETRTCERLVCTGGSCLDENIDYYRLPAVSAASLHQGATVLAIVGCPASPVSSGDTTYCGAGWTPSKGNLRALALGLVHAPTLNSAVVPAQLANLVPSFGSVSATWQSSGSSAALATPTPYEGVASSVGSIPLPPQGNVTAYGTDGIRLAFGAADAGADAAAARTLAISMADIQGASDPRSLPAAFFASNGGLAIVVLGDPREQQLYLDDGGANPAYRGRGLHVLALPTSPRDAGAD